MVVANSGQPGYSELFPFFDNTPASGSIMRLRYQPRLCVNCLATVFLLFASLGTGATLLAQDTREDNLAGKKIESTVRVAKLLWSVNAKSAAKTLSVAIDQAVDRGEIAAIRNPLAALAPQADALIEKALAGNASDDPRVAVALSMRFIAGAKDAWSVSNKMLGRITDLQERRLVIRVALAADQQTSLQMIQEQLQAKSESDPQWQSIMVREAISANPAAGSRIAVNSWSHLSSESQLEVIEPMTLSPASMLTLLEAIDSGTVSKSLVNMNQLRKWSSMRATGDVAQIGSAIEKIWGTVRLDENAAREKLVASTLEKIRSGASGSEASGKVVFKRLCSQCHRLGGNGFEVGPDITSNGRGNLQQLVSNVLDPSLVIGEAFQAVVLMTVEGNVASGILVSDTEDFVRLKLQGGKIAEFAREDIEEIQKAKRSLMPEGLEQQTTAQEMLDLFAFLSVVRLPNGEEQIIPGVPDNFIQP